MEVDYRLCPVLPIIEQYMSVPDLYGLYRVMGIEYKIDIKDLLREIMFNNQWYAIQYIPRNKLHSLNWKAIYTPFLDNKEFNDVRCVSLNTGEIKMEDCIASSSTKSYKLKSTNKPIYNPGYIIMFLNTDIKEYADIYHLMRDDEKSAIIKSISFIRFYDENIHYVSPEYEMDPELLQQTILSRSENNCGLTYLTS